MGFLHAAAINAGHGGVLFYMIDLHIEKKINKIIIYIVIIRHFLYICKYV